MFHNITIFTVFLNQFMQPLLIIMLLSKTGILPSPKFWPVVYLIRFVIWFFFNSELQVLEVARLNALDTRSFIMRKPELEQTPPVKSRPSAVIQTEDPPITSRMVQARYDRQISS